MKRYNCTLSDKRGAFGLCMEEHKEGMFVPFSAIEKLQTNIQQLLEGRNSTGLAIDKAILSGIVPDQHPLRSRLDLLANHRKREQELSAQLEDATRQCGVMAELLREATRLIPVIGVAMDDLPVVDAFIDRIDAALAGKVPGHVGDANKMVVPEGWTPCDVRLPEPGVVVLVYAPPQDGDWPDDVRISFDCIDPEGDDHTYWVNHGEFYEHYLSVACAGMTGPSETAPYTHWIAKPAAQKSEGGDRG